MCYPHHYHCVLSWLSLCCVVQVVTIMSLDHCKVGKATVITHCCCKGGDGKGVGVGEPEVEAHHHDVVKQHGKGMLSSSHVGVIHVVDIEQA